jgi:CheY-like chemotaxis protein
MTPKKPKLLVVDDDHSVRESLKKLLETEHYDVHPARDGVEALDYFRSSPTDLVVLDLNLGTDDGWKIFHTMAELNPFVPTVIITAEFDQRERAVAAGVEALIEKPIDVPVFLKIISDLLAETSEQRLERVCGNDEYCRYVARHYEPFLSLLNERHSAPLKFSTALNAALLTLSLAGEATDRDGNLAIVRDSLSDSHKPKNSYGDDIIDREKASHSRPLLERR